VEKCSPKFYDLKIYGKTHVQCVKQAHVHRRHETIQNLPLPLLRFCDHGLVRIVRDLTVKKSILASVLCFQWHIYY